MNAHDRQRLVFAAPEDLAGYELLATPIWVFDADRHAMWWGNRAALGFWGADSTEDLRARDFSSDSLVVRERLRQIVSAHAPDFLIEETWTLYPQDRPRSLDAKVMPVLIEGGRNAILVEVTRMIDMAGDDGALRLLEAARTSPLMISSFREDGRLLAQNPAASEAYGIEREKESDAPGSIFRRYPEPGLARRLLDIVVEDSHLDTESEVLTTFGRRWHRLHAARGRDPLTGDFTVVITEDDITARLQAQDAARVSFAETEARTREDARLSMARMRAAIEAIPDGFCLYDSDDRLVLFNQRYREMYPKHSDMLELGGRFEDMLRVGVARGEFLDAIGREEDWIAERMRAHRNPGEPLEQRLADGRWLLTEEKRTPEGETVGLRINITEFKTLQRALEHSESRFRDFAYSAADWFWEMDADLRFTYLSGNVERLVGVPAEWHYGKTRKELMGESYDPAEWAGHEQVLRERRPFRNFEYRRVGVGVEPKWLRVSGVPFFDADGNFAGYRGSGSDVTEQRLNQERLRESEARLFRAQKMEAVGHLTGGIAHDFNNLLSVIQGNLELIEENLAEPELKSMIGASLRAVSRGATLASQLLTFGRRARLSPVALNLNDQLTAMAGMIRISLPAQVEIATWLADDLWPVELDVAQVESAILNIVINAAGAMPDGGKLTISTDNVSLKEGNIPETALDLAPGRYALVTIRDTGKGMDAETRARACDPFFTTKPVGRGTGLGLSIVHGFAAQSGGGTVIESAPGQGTTVSLYFPARPEQAVTRCVTEMTPVPRSARAESILVAEDDTDVRRALTAHLRNLGYQVTEARDGAEALSVLKCNLEIDLLLSDMMLGGSIGGAELARQARVLRPGLRVIFMTGLPSEAPHGGTPPVPGEEVLGKPVSKAILARAIWKILNDGAAKDESFRS